MKNALAICLLAALAPAAASAAGNTVQIYGRLNLALEYAGAAGGGTTRLSNNRSVIGFRGSEDLGGGTAVLFQIESAVSPDTGGGAFAGRDTRIGLQGRLGTLFAGNWSTPYTGSTSTLDPFYPTTAGYMSIMGNGSASSGGNLDEPAAFDRRQKNSVHFWTPAWRSWSLRLAHGLSEERPAGGARPALTSAALIYDGGALYAALAHERHREYHAGGDDKASKAAVSYGFGGSRIALIYERLEYGGGALRRSAVYLSGTHQMGQHSIRLGIARAGDGRGLPGWEAGFIKAAPDSGALHATLGYDYQLSKRSSLFAYYSRLRNDGNGEANFAINSVAAPPGATLRALAFGMRHGF